MRAGTPAAPGGARSSAAGRRPPASGGPQREEDEAAAGDRDGQPHIAPAVALAQDEEAPEHDGEHLGALPKRLHREAHVLEGLVPFGVAMRVMEVGMRCGAQGL
jgi:hypothetical protein